MEFPRHGQCSSQRNSYNEHLPAFVEPRQKSLKPKLQGFLLLQEMPCPLRKNYSALSLIDLILLLNPRAQEMLDQRLVGDITLIRQLVQFRKFLTKAY